MRNVAVGFITVLVLLTGCGDSNPSLNEYVEALNVMNDEFSPRGAAIFGEYLGRPAPTMDDLRA